ncbi:PA domain containing protein [Niveomyces insectorum RCEF 264]|uniref:RING-type E3 ubiquitin transferase n=1 Tax=Niveomyces insectorum RCEF 264 TaxID=1081102 RepID=A0A167W3P0_9HYPO|nr:PA domain containing protein [Niveomyces insectorum RCEF 264]
MALLVRALSLLAASTVTVLVIVRSMAATNYPLPSRSRPLSTVPAFQLFPPNAAISLTEDNSTFFPARPAAFGAALPDNGLSAILWIGAGFGEDEVEPQGELGCSDVPGWDGRRAADGAPIFPDEKRLDDGTDNYLEDFSTGAYYRNLHKTVHAKAAVAVASGHASDPADINVANVAPVIRGSAPQASTKTGKEVARKEALRKGASRKDASRKDMSRTEAGHNEVPHHGDIQSLQEGAEIAGKIVLLRRGGCGFLAKVMWAQRRGAVAVIVGDDRKGGPLVQMYASGDTSFVTIPSVFTAHTTAHLLTALVASAVQDDDAASKKEAAANEIETETTTGTTTPQKTETADSWFWKTRPREWVLDEYVPTEATATATTATNPTDANAKATPTEQAGGGSASASGRGRGRGSTGMDSNRVLYVTIAPTRGGLPLVDTLLVVVTSPFLAVLTIMGVLLFLRTQCRYRAWRAPKSLVAQLPVHVFMPPGAPPPGPVMVPVGSAAASPASSPPSSPPSSPRLPSLEPSITTPLLQRPRSRTTTGVPGDERRITISLPAPPPHAPSRYFQAECVVCLEEYVAGDRIMSLPCGHEFHAACITPWLTTRRRTCPICKGDVVKAAAGESA